jgi:hypothetical protein
LLEAIIVEGPDAVKLCWMGLARRIGETAALG